MNGISRYKRKKERMSAEDVRIWIQECAVDGTQCKYLAKYLYLHNENSTNTAILTSQPARMKKK